jgi:hypothetical protein
MYPGAARTAFLVADSTHRGTIQWGDRDLLTETLKGMHHLRAGLLEDFDKRNSAPRQLSHREFRTRRAPVRLPTRTQKERMRRESLRWDGYPGWLPGHGLITLSRVGFTPDMQHALVNVDFHCGGRCGGGQLIVLVKHDDRWIVQQRKRIFIS